MGTRFAKYQPMVIRKNERERLLFIAAAGLAFSLLIIMLVVLNYKSEANARAPERITATTPQNNVPASMGTVTLFVPERQVSPGQKLSEVTLKEVYWPRNEVPEGAIRDLAEIREQFAKVNLPAGVPLQRDQLSKQPTQATLPLTPGNRAVSIDVDETSSLEGHALPGTHVDVVLTYFENKNLTSKVIVQNARVLSYGGDSTPAFQRPSYDRHATGRTITLDVSPKDSLKIQTARCCE